MSFELPKLDYSKTALSPIMSEETLDLHHGKHHQTYITNLNNLIKDTEMSKMSLEDIIINSSKDKSKIGIFNNASQHWNHILFRNAKTVNANDNGTSGYLVKTGKNSGKVLGHIRGWGKVI